MPRRKSSVTLQRQGAPPGTIVVDPDAACPVMRVFAYGPDDFVERQPADVKGVRDLVDTHRVVWVNVDGLGDAATIAQLGELFGLHRLALEDVAHTGQRSKLEVYGDRLFIVARAVHLQEDELRFEQISLFLGPGFVVSFQEWFGDCFDPIRDRIRKGAGLLRNSGPDYLAYALLDATIDNYFPILESYADRLETLEDDVGDLTVLDTLTRLHAVKRDLHGLRHAIWPLREAAGALVRDKLPQFSDETRLYLRDSYDHTVRILELAESFREQTADLMNLRMSSVSNRTSDIMRVLTIIATIFIPLTFISGIYGMNFDTATSPLNMPELEWAYGYPFALGLMATSAAGMLYYVRRKGWL
jgi:magnesium transporter